MKALCFYFLVLFLIIVPCNGQPNAQQEKIQPQVLTANTANSGDDPYCFSQAQIFPETAIMWQASWEAFHNYNLGQPIYPGSPNYIPSPSFTIPATTMSTLYNALPENPVSPGVLISYLRMNNNPYPQIAIQNMVNCNNTAGTIYRANYSPTGRISETSEEMFTDRKNNWIDFIASKDEVFSIAEGYMYSWASLKNETNDATRTGITIRYGLRTLEPGEQTFFIDNGSADGRTGSVVYCNVLYFGEQEETDGTWAPLYDFAKPCPTFCNR